MPPDDHVLVYPRLIPLGELGIPSCYPAGDERTESRLFPDPTRTVGVRDYRPGDPLKAIHWKASARQRRLQVKVFEAATTRKIAIFVAVNSFGPDAAGPEGDFEFSLSVAASLAYDAIGRGASVGLFANSRLADTGQPASLDPAGGQAHLTAILEALAKVTPAASGLFAPFLQEELRMLCAGTTFVFILSSLPATLPPLLEGLKRAGRPLILLWIGEGDPGPLPARIPCHRLRRPAEECAAEGRNGKGNGGTLGDQPETGGEAADGAGGGRGRRRRGYPMNGHLLTPGVVIAGLEACWLYALSYAYHAWTPWPRRRWLLRELTGWLLWAVLLFGWTVFSHAVQGGWAGSSLSGTLAVSAWPEDLLATAAVGGLWFMGRRLGSLGTDFALCLGEFQFGLAMLVTIYYADAQFGIPLGPLVPLTVLYFVLGLTGLSISREEGGTEHTDGAPQGGRFGPLAASLGIILLMALWIFFVITPDLLAWGLSVIVEIGRAFIRVLAWLIGFLASLFPAPDTGPIQTPPPMGSPKHDDALDLAHWLVMPESVRMVGQILVGAAWIILFLLPLWRISTDILQWLRKRAGFTQGSESEALKGAFREDLLRLIGAIREKFLAFVRCFRPRPGRAALDSGTAGVRQAYRLLLGWAAAAECRRNSTRTPDEHLVALEAWLPEARGEFAFITGQYVRARYGPGPVEEGTLRELDLCLRTVRRLRRKKGHRRIL